MLRVSAFSVFALSLTLVLFLVEALFSWLLELSWLLDWDWFIALFFVNRVWFLGLLSMSGVACLTAEIVLELTGLSSLVVALCSNLAVLVSIVWLADCSWLFEDGLEVPLLLLASTFELFLVDTTVLSFSA